LQYKRKWYQNDQKKILYNILKVPINPSGASTRKTGEKGEMRGKMGKMPNMPRK